MDVKRAMAAAVYFVRSFPVLYAMGSAVCYARCGKLRRCRCVAEDETAVWFWARMCFIALQAIIAELAVLLPLHSWRITRALAYLVVAVLVVGRCTYASVLPQGMPRDIKILIASGIFGLTVADLHSFLFLARGSQE